MKIFNKISIPSNISYMWNFGSMISILMFIQILTGFYLSMNFNNYLLFNYMFILNLNLKSSWMMINIHNNTASMFFMCMYIHIVRNIYFNSFKIYFTWMIGMLMYLMSMIISFLGYLLPWNQMSFWAMMVLTNMILFKNFMKVMYMVWGDIFITPVFIKRSFSFHFIMPFILLFFFFMHLASIHIFSSNNTLGMMSKMDKLSFNPFFYIKDLLTIYIIIYLILMIMYFKPFFFMKPDNFNMANSISTPYKILPEWYFYMYFSIIRSITNKYMGLLLLFFFFFFFIIIFYIFNNKKFINNMFFPVNKMMLWKIYLNLIFMMMMSLQTITFYMIEFTKLLILMNYLYLIMNLYLMKTFNFLNY